jgi:ribosomal protein S18 acetylase RimI-like enzyme
MNGIVPGGERDRSHSIRAIEEFTLNAWPALSQVLLDGWVLRFADGYTRRSNSVNPLYPGTGDVHEKARACEGIYKSVGLPTTFKLTPDSIPTGLDQLLLERAYREAAGASVQLRNLGNFAGMTESAVTFRAWDSPADEWLDAFISFNVVVPRHRETLRSIIASILPARRLIAVLEAGAIVACGLGVAQPPFVGLFDIVTRPDRRNRGIGAYVVTSLLRWGREQGAAVGCLQVMLDNPAAWGLYAKLGFREAYRYTYFVKD